MSIDGLTAFTMLAFASAGFCGGAVFGGAKVASIRARHAHLIKGVRLALYHLEMGHSKTLTMNALNDALDTDRRISIAIQEGFPEQAGPWPDPHSEPAGDFPNTRAAPVHLVGDRND